VPAKRERSPFQAGLQRQGEGVTSTRVGHIGAEASST
jgi:hypothetical protein